MRALKLISWLALGAVFLAACGEEAASSEAPVAPSAAPVAAAPTARARTTLADAQGATLAVLMPRDDGGGWRIEDEAGEKTGSLRVTDDRVNAKDAADRRTGRAKRRDYGFKVEDAHEETVLKVQRRDQRFRLKRGDDQVIGWWTGARIELNGGVVIDAIEADGRVTVRRAGAPVATVDGPFPAQAALFLGLTEELSLEQRLAAMVFVREVRF
ncbi:MAG: hypothetical protein SangKO_047470 [Sandaracinaceae bacterium]